jgi:hypothetical protein
MTDIKNLSLELERTAHKAFRELEDYLVDWCL